ncbi:MAG: hypothetical protein AB2535_18795 [Candidatus Thiodiazotropha endolucinida]
MTPNARFDELLNDIEPSSTTKSNASTAHNRLRETLRTDEDFGLLHRTTFLSGSYKRDTAIRPRVKNGNTSRPDIDIIVVTEHDFNDRPSDVIDDVHAALNRHYTPTNRQARSVSVSTSLADMDVVPLIDPDNSGEYYIADRRQELWLRTNPPGHTQWTTEINTRCGGRFKPIVKLFKWWRRENSTISKRPKGFVLEVIAAECLNPNEKHYGELFVQMLERIVECYTDDIHYGVVPFLDDPSLPGNNILTGVSFDAFKGFYNKVVEHAVIGRNAILMTDQDQATEEWQKLFGGRFPNPPDRKDSGIMESTTVGAGLTFPDHPVRPRNTPEGFA